MKNLADQYLDLVAKADGEYRPRRAINAAPRKTADEWRASAASAREDAKKAHPDAARSFHHIAAAHDLRAQLADQGGHHEFPALLSKRGTRVRAHLEHDERGNGTWHVRTDLGHIMKVPHHTHVVNGKEQFRPESEAAKHGFRLGTERVPATVTPAKGGEGWRITRQDGGYPAGARRHKFETPKP